MRTPLRVLILEDKASDAALMVVELRRAGFTPEWRWVKSEAEFLASLSPGFDVILVDYNLPQYNALDALSAVQLRCPEVPVIVVTGTVGEDVAVECIKKGAEDYFLKDRMARLGAAVRQALRKKELLAERRRTEERVRHLNRVLKAVRDINQLIVRERDPDLLMADACAVLVGTRGYRMVWLGLTDPGNKRVIAASCAGDGADFLEDATITWDDGELGRGPTGTAIRERRPDVCGNIATDPRMAPWRDAALARGFASVLAAPILYEDRAFGALVGYKERPEAFDDEEIGLLAELAGDMGFALQSIEERTRRKEAEEALRASEEYYRSLVEISPDAILLIDLEGKILFCNHRTSETLGFATSDELTGRNAFDFVAPEDIARAKASFRKTIESGIQRFNEYTFLKMDGSPFPVETNSARVVGRDGRPAGLMIVGRDVSEKKALEARFEHAQKMEAVGRLAGGVAHDFNNLLTAIIGYANLALLKIKPGDPGYCEIRTILDTGERGARLVGQLMAFSRKQVVHPVVLQLNEVVGGMDRMVRRLIGEDIRCRFLLDPELKAVRADPGQIEQVLLNLIVNARDAMPDGGSLEIRTDNVSLDAEYCRLHREVSPGDFVRLDVSDTGSGISRETMEHIFEPFFTTRPNGTGLGLSTVYGIVKQLRGHVSAYSEKGHGAAFKIYLPALPEPVRGEGTSAEGRRPDSEAVPPGGRESVLVAEDEEVIRELMVSFLSELGYSVLSAASSEEALEKIRGRKGAIDLLLSDVILPGMRGPELAGEMKKIFPAMEVIFTSGYADGRIAEYCAANGNVDFLAKPFPLIELARKVRHVLDRAVRA